MAFGLLLSLFGTRAAFATPPGPAPLRPLDDRTLGIGESHDYYFPMKKGEYLRIDVEQNDDIDAGIRLFDSKGKLLVHSNSYTGTHGAETMSWIAERDEVLWVQVYAWEDLPGRFTAYVDGPRLSTPSDSLRSSAVWALLEGIRLEELLPHPRLAEALNRYKQAEAAWSRLSETRWKAVSRRHIGNILYMQGDKPGARRVFRSLWPTLLDLRETGLILEIATYLVEEAIETRDLSQLDSYNFTALSYISQLDLATAANRSRYFADQAARTGRIETEAQFLRVRVHSLETLQQRAALVESLGRLSRSLRRLGRIEESLSAAARQAALAISEVEKIQATLSLALAQIAQQRPDLALLSLGQLPQAELPPELSAELHYAIGWTNFDVGNYREATNHFTKAAALRVPGAAAAIDLTFLALAQIRDGRISDASLSLARASEMPRAPDPGVGAFLFRTQSELALRENRVQDALRYLDAAFQELDRQRLDPASDLLRASYWSTKMSYIEFGIELLLSLADSERDSRYTDEAFRLVDGTRARILAEYFERHLEAPLQRKVDSGNLPRELREMDSTLTNLQRRRPPGWRQIRSTLLRQREEVILQSVLSSKKKEIQRVDPPARLLPDSRPSLGPDVQLISYFLGAKRSYAFVVEHNNTTAVALAPRRQIETVARRAYEALRDSRNPAGMTAALKASAELGDLVWRPVQPLLKTKRILLSPDGNLHQIPFAAIPLDPFNESLVVDQYDIAIIDSLNFFAFHNSERSNCSGTALVRPTDSNGPVGQDSVAIAQFEPDFRIIPAQRSAILGGLSQFCQIHFATHGSGVADWPITSSLVLSESDSGERLYAFEVAELHLRAKLVVLAACESGLGEIGGEGLFGLPAAFLAAGSRQVLGSTWVVDSAATSELMNIFYAALKTNGDPVAALGIAQRKMRHTPEREAPAFWAGFQAVGDSRISQ